MSVKVVRYSAEWCGPCRALVPVFNRLQQMFAPKGVVFEEIDAQANYSRTERDGVRSVPTVIIYKNGVEVQRLIGGLPETAYMDNINSHL